MSFLKTYRRVLQLLLVERQVVIGLALVNVLAAALSFAEPILFGQLVDVLTGAAAHPAADIWRASAVTLGAWGVVGLSGILANLLLALYADRLAHRRRLAVAIDYFDHALSLSPTFHAATHSARLLRTLVQATHYLFGFWLAFLREHLSTLVTLMVLLPLSMLLNWHLALLLIALMLSFTLLTTLGVRRTEAAQSIVAAEDSELAARAGDAFANVALIQSYAARDREVDSLGELARRILRTQYPVLTYWAGLNVLSRAASTVTIICIFLLGTWLTVHGQATVGQIVTFMGFSTALIGRLEHIGRFVSQMFVEMPTLVAFFAVMDKRPGVRERPDTVALGRARGSVSFDHVSFSYDGLHPAVSDLTFDVAAGRVVALVGPTGAGKTTAMSLLVRFHDPTAGAIRIDGTDIRDIGLDSLRHGIGIVFQDSTTLHRSIADNIRLGRPHAGDDEVIRAAKLAEAHEFISMLPDQYNTKLGERGSTLSGGERQRIAIARALLKDPPILILDEATSALDAVTEATVRRALTALMRGRTTFIIAHRLSMVSNADLVLVFDRGRITEIGSPAELVARNGLYARYTRMHRDLGDPALYS